MPVETHSPPFEIKAFSGENLFTALSSEVCNVHELESTELNRPKYITSYLEDLSASCILIEYDYIDGDYLDDYSFYYSRCYKQYRRKCKRIHFFTKEFTSATFRELVVNHSDDSISETLGEYLGFVVARPLPFAVIGRTILKTYPSEGGRRNYPATREYAVNIFGINLSIVSLAFQEQDTVIAACATVALWSAFQRTALLFDTAAPRPAEITSSALNIEGVSRGFPSHGLIIQQMIHAIRKVNLAPEIIQVTRDLPLVSYIYGHLAYGLPVILIIDIEGNGRHAITLNGYSITEEKCITQEVSGDSEKRPPMIGLRINEFYGHDDQIGPFARFKIQPSGSGLPIVFTGSWVHQETRAPLILKPICLLIPVYNKIRVTMIDINKWVERVWRLINARLRERDRCEWSIYITDTNTYKNSVLGSLLASEDKEHVLLGQHPKYIWCASFSFDKAIRFTILFDATDMQRSFPCYDIVWHCREMRDIMREVLANTKLEKEYNDILTPKYYKFLRDHT